MRMSPYVLSVEIEVRNNCIRAIKSLEEQIETAEANYTQIISGLKARIDDCKATVDHINMEIGG